MSPRAVDHLNVGLMLFALGAAFALPFELFLFSYAVLGPLHYLTEISWLHERRYFTRGRSDWIWLVVLVLLLVAGTPFVLGEHRVRALAPYSAQLTFAAFAMALVFTRFDRAVERALGALAVLVLTFAFAGVAARSWFLFALYVSTIVHVCVFTGAFMLFGALKARSGSAWFACAAFVVCSAAALLVPAGAVPDVGGYVRASYGAFASLNAELLKLFGLGAGARDVYGTTGGTVVMRFIAFAYTYHYLNWFSKTSIIRWHQVDKSKLALAAVLWVASLGLYAADYQLGARWLFFLSFLHVVLEFPLNHVAFQGIASELRARLSPRAAA